VWRRALGVVARWWCGPNPPSPTVPEISRNSRLSLLSQVIEGMDHRMYESVSTLLVNEGSSKIGIHHDPPAPLPALIAGPGTAQLADGKWQPFGAGGRLFLADGLFDISYGPRDVVLIDGNVPHGITRLSAPTGTTAGRPELERFSLIMFSTFKRRDRMLKHGNYSPMWQEEWQSAVLYKV
jgi:hypothetical protein